MDHAQEHANKLLASVPLRRLQLRICRDCRQNVMQAYKVALTVERRQQRSGQLALPAPSPDSSSGCAFFLPLRC